MKPLSEDEVGRIAALARIALTGEERRRLAGELTSILTHMDALASVTTDGIEPMTHAVPMSLRLRSDEAAPSLPTESAVASAPDVEVDQFRVPPVISRGVEK